MPTWAATWILAGGIALAARMGAGVTMPTALGAGLLLAGTIHVLAFVVLRSARVNGAAVPTWVDPWATVAAARRRADVEAERVSVERVRGNVRLMGLAELWSAVSEEDPDTALLHRVMAFCARETGHRELGLFRLDARAGEIKGHWIEPTEDGARVHRLRWALGGLDGGIVRVLRTEKRFETFDGSHVPLLTVNGERPRVMDRDRGYAILPLVAPAPLARCLDPGSRRETSCEDYQAHPASGRPENGADSTLHPAGSPCTTCRRFPVHGVLVVTDAGSGRAPTPGQTGLLESLTTTIASVLEHAALFRDVKSAERFREQVLDAMRNGLLSTDSRGRVVFANHEARALLGTDDLEGRDLEALLELPEGSTALTRSLVEGETHLQAEGLARAESADGPGEPVPVRIHLSPFRPEDGGRKGTVCVLEDLRAVRAMEDEIRHLDTLAAIGRFASSLAHEIRNPLGGIQAGIEFLARGLDATEDNRQNLDVIHGEIRRLDGILRNLLSVARPRELVLGECDPAEVADKVVRSFGALADTIGVALRVKASAAVESIHADRDMLAQVLTNLVKNALEASPPGGAVELHVTARPETEGRGVVFEVLDRGPGLDEADLPHLFEPFFSRKSSGTGLGLYVCHGLVRRHGGSLRAANRSGGGARFVVELPRVPALMGGRHEPTHSGRR